MPMKKKPEDLVAEIRAYLRGAARPQERPASWARYFREGYDAWGLLDKDHPIWNEKRQEWLESYGGFKGCAFPEGRELLFRSGKLPKKAPWPFAFLKNAARRAGCQVRWQAAQWFEAGIQNWAHTDVSLRRGDRAAAREPPARSRRAGRLRESEFPVPAKGRACGHALACSRRSRKSTPLLDFLRPLIDGSGACSSPGRGLVFCVKRGKKTPGR